MTMNLSTEVRMIKGVGPQRAELLAQRGVYTIRARVMSGQAIRSMRGGRDAIYHLLVQDDAGGLLPCKFFHGGYLEGRLKPGQLLILHGKAEVDKLRPA